MRVYFSNRKIFLIILLAFLILPGLVLAANPLTNLVQATPPELNKTLPDFVGLFIKTLLGLLGIIFLVLIIYAGFLWGTAGGEEGRIQKARGIIIAAIIGLIITLSAYAITLLVLEGVGVTPAT